MEKSDGDKELDNKAERGLEFWIDSTIPASAPQNHAIKTRDE
jgi:hypothetical protein